MAGNTRRSLQELSEEVATNPNTTAFVELAAAYRERGDLERAMRLCLRGLQRHPTHVEAHFELGRIYEARGDRELALDEWSVVRQLAPDHLATILELVRLYLEEGRRAEAEVELREAERVAPEEAEVVALRAQLDRPSAGESTEQERPPAGDVFRGLELEQPGTLGVLLVDSEGQVIGGHMVHENGDPQPGDGVNLVSARAEAERVASYLDLGELRGMVVESGGTRLTISPVGRDVIIVATRSDVPAGQAARLVQRAWEVAEEYLSDMGR